MLATKILVWGRRENVRVICTTSIVTGYNKGIVLSMVIPILKAGFSEEDVGLTSTGSNKLQLGEAAFSRLRRYFTLPARCSDDLLWLELERLVLSVVPREVTGSSPDKVGTYPMGGS
ncbi:predicted protein [Histoplasma capsulatum G186AR]|uniref:Uncharacterized protein n=1 Tax=Ajellomyces capsulatus (strain G186AR / H82 / ATCC MYA-2454 / RMSCC 2432) TaxID=447093 RepID=C0NUG9_AJECG|nr:uncharacterized protein HCBG_07000 [Histoplasma capsulatum G186AR]EEH05049.1 predicted protein [Histoplasma capsulatum G186AR]